MDVAAQISQLWVYPVKSCAGISVNEGLLIETGLEFDRAWMVVDAAGHFVTQRELPRMALIQPQFKFDDLVLRAPGMLALHVALEKVEHAARVRIWSDEVAAYDMGDTAAHWFSDFLGIPLRLVRFDPDQMRLSSPKWTGEIQAPNQFSDGYPLLVISEASLHNLNGRLQAAGQPAVTMARFRPNLVLSGLQEHDEDRLDTLHIETVQGEVRLKGVKPCPRCPIPNIDPLTALSTPDVGDMLQRYRANPLVGGAVSFGMNLVMLGGVDHVLRVGQHVAANYRFD